ncbi:universal stress protein [Halopenitus sp. H-Gu1]|uniref:universal stress protein n=1 Tax=Halopenitus sp. H-Gu1 TaxID=3242697 RepID=UPI00359CDC6E
MYDRILLPTDGSEGVDRAAEHAIDAAKRYDAALHVLFVVDDGVINAYPGDEFVHEFEGVERTLEEFGRETVDQIGAEATDAGVEPVVTEVVHGEPHETILEYIDEENIDLIVMGTKERSGEYRQLLGSVTERVARRASDPVTIVKTAVE